MKGRKRIGTRPRSSATRRVDDTDVREAAKRLLCQIIEAYGGRLSGSLRLYKAFYAAHLFYWNTGVGTLTNYPIVRMAIGPGILDSRDLLNELAAEGFLRIGEQYNGPHREDTYELIKSYPTDVADSGADAAQDAIQKAVLWTKDKTTAELSEETRAYSRSWRQAEDGEELDIYIDVLSEEDYERIQARRPKVEALIHNVFGA